MKTNAQCRCWVAAALLPLLGLGCAMATPVAPATTAPKAVQIYGSWEVDTLASLDQLLTIKACEGWEVEQIFTRQEKLVAVLAHVGPAPAPSDACR